MSHFFSLTSPFVLEKNLTQFRNSVTPFNKADEKTFETWVSSFPQQNSAHGSSQDDKSPHRKKVFRSIRKRSVFFCCKPILEVTSDIYAYCCSWWTEKIRLMYRDKYSWIEQIGCWLFSFICINYAWVGPGLCLVCITVSPQSSTQLCTLSMPSPSLMSTRRKTRKNGSSTILGALVIVVVHIYVITSPHPWFPQSHKSISFQYMRKTSVVYLGLGEQSTG